MLLQNMNAVTRALWCEQHVLSVQVMVQGTVEKGGSE